MLDLALLSPASSVRLLELKGVKIRRKWRKTRGQNLQNSFSYSSQGFSTL
jgi:hypothetical protein